jgi:hypothetical protein
MAKYRAKAASFGFRGRHWVAGDIAENVTEDENIPEHFEPLPDEEVAEQPKDESFEPPEPTTLSEWQKHGQESTPPPGLEKEKPKPEPKHEPKAPTPPEKPKAHFKPHQPHGVTKPQARRK